jgi:GNAT superfamily N-acetyltransferase
MAGHEWRRGEYRITTDPDEIDVDVVHGFLTTCYWAWGITRERVARSIAGSIPFGLFARDQQVAFARVISDQSTFAWVADVFVLPAWRGRGLGVWLVEAMLAHPDLQGLRRWSLATRDAHSLYARFGFVRLATPERMMELRPSSPEAGGPAPSTTTSMTSAPESNARVAPADGAAG